MDESAIAAGLVAIGLRQAVQPESLPITVQMDIYRKAEVLIFAEGSACVSRPRKSGPSMPAAVR